MIRNGRTITAYAKRDTEVGRALVRRAILAVLLLLALLAAAPLCAHANPAMVKLELNRTTTSYDITGDGKKDTLRISGIPVPDIDGYRRLTVYVNGKQVFCDAGSYSYFYTFEASLCTLANGKPFLYLYNPLDNGDATVCGIYQYKGGKLRRVFDFNTFYQPGSHQNGTAVRVSGNRLIVRERVMSHALGNIEADFTLKYKNGTLTLASRTGTMHKIYMMGNPQPSYPKLRYSVDLYTSQTSSRRAGTLQKGTPVKITKVYVGPKFVRFLLTTRSGKRGWYQSQTRYIYGRQPILEGTFYAG